MAGKKTDDSPFSKFFTEESQEFLEKQENKEEQVTYAQKKIPFIPQANPTTDTEIKDRWKTLRKFFLNSQGGKLPNNAESVHLSHHYLTDGILSNYPVWISKGPEKTSNGDSSLHCISLNQLLLDQIQSFYPEPGKGKMIKELLPRIIKEISLKIQQNGTSNLHEAFDGVTTLLVEKLNLRGGDKETFEEQVAQLKSGIPTQGELLPYSNLVTSKILQVTLSKAAYTSRQEFIARIHKILHKLMDILDVEYENDPESTNPEHLKSSLDFADTFLDFNTLSGVIPESASEHIPEERHSRIKSVIETLTKSEAHFSIDATLVVQKKLLKSEGTQFQQVFSDSDIIEVDGKDLCSESMRIYQEKLNEFTHAVKALRIGELEIDNKYLPELHDETFSSFDSYSFTEEEVSFFPPVILITPSPNLLNEGLTGFTNILHQNIPVNIVALRTINEDASSNSIDPTSLAISYRNTYVTQLTSLDPGLMFNKFYEGITSYSPSLFYLETANANNDRDGSLIELSAHVESRNFPAFVYNGKIGTAWGSRFDIKDNPQYEQDWPIYEYVCKNSEGKDSTLTVPFTFADFATIKPHFHSEYMEIEPEFWTDDLILLSEYLLLPDKERYGKIPFIWMIHGDQLIKVAVSWKLVMASDAKKDFWNYLQDCGGVHSYHADKAVQDQQKMIRQETNEEIARLKEAHAAELEKVKEESAKDAMEHLTAALLDIDIDSESIVASDNPIRKTSEKESSVEEDAPKSDKSDKSDKPETPEATAPTEEEEDLVSEEPWIETPLCTNCNECIDINNRMFNYNADKQAFIADPKAGTFAQLVDAAEKCPVGIIHPGKPLNPDEPGIDDLVKRAEKFN